jgi:hypothetical protein
VSTLLLTSAGSVFGVSGFTLDFNNPAGSTLANTGFADAYNLDPTGFDVGGGALTIRTLPGDTFGNYENDPDSAKNMFYTPVDVGPQTVAVARVNVSGLNVNFHGGGIWMGTDQDHYVRFGIFHNSFIGGGPVGVELLRENEDRWGGASPAGQGDDIVSVSSAVGNTSARDVILRLTRNGNSVVGEYSLDNGGTFIAAGSLGGLALPGDPQGLGSNTIEGPASFKVGVYAFGGPDGSSPGVFAFDSLVVTPEPASLASLAIGGLLLRRRR